MDPPVPGRAPARPRLLLPRLAGEGRRGEVCSRAAAPRRAESSPSPPSPAGGGGIRPLVLQPSLRRDLRGEVARRAAVDALAEREAGEAGDLDRRAGALAGRLDHLGDARLAVDDEDLLLEDDLLVELAQPA